MKKARKITSLLMAICMLISLLPAQFALAADDPQDDDTHTDYDSEFVTRVSSISEIPSSYRGQVWIWNKETSTIENKDYYSLTVAAYGATGNTFMQAIKVNENVLHLYAPDMEAEVWEDPDSFASSARVDGTFRQEMVISDKWSLFDGKPLYASSGNYLFEDSSCGLAYTEADDSPSGKDYYKLFVYQGVQDNIYKAAKATNLTNSTTGSLYEKRDDGAIYYTFPYQNLEGSPAITMYTLYFTAAEGAAISADDIGIYYDSNEVVYGAGEAVSSYGNNNYTYHKGVYFVGFPAKSTSKQKIHFNEINGEDGPLDDASISIYDNENYTGSAVATVSAANADHSYDTASTLDPEKNYWYKITRDKYNDYTGGPVNTGTSGGTVASLTLVKTGSEAVETAFVVTDADTGKTLSGAEVRVDGTLIGTTNSSGTITKEYSASATKDVTVTLSGYTTLTKSFTGGSTVSLPMVPTRKTVTLPKVYNLITRDELSNASITITKLVDDDNHKTDAWTPEASYLPGQTAEVPMGNSFTITASKAGYKSGSIYLDVSSTGTLTWYKSSTLSGDTVDGTEIAIEALDDPFYEVNIEKDTSNEKKLKATVTLNNVKATLGTFGLKYDKNLISSINFTPNTEKLGVVAILNDSYPAIAESSGEETTGYHVFSWQGDLDGLLTISGEDGVDATVTGGVKIAEYEFTLADGKTATDLAADSFSVMPFDKTKLAQDYVSNIDDDDDTPYDQNEFFYEKWRYVDDQNVAGSLGDGRLSADKAFINGGDTKGFYQAFVNNVKGDDVPGAWYDIMTYINFDYKKSSLTFNVTDKTTKAPLEGASVYLYNSTGETLVKTLSTDNTGAATTVVDASDGNVTYKYVVSANGYWDNPETDKAETVVLPPAEGQGVTNVSVEMEKKIYHTPKLQNNDGDDLVATNAAVLGGDKFAYYSENNTRDFHFTIEPAPGMKLENDPGEVNVLIGKDTDHEELIEHLAIDKATGTYTLPAAKITNDPCGDTADENGFPSDDIIIIYLGDTTESNETYTVTGFADEHGVVTYESDADEWPLSTTVTNTDQSKTVDNISPKETEKSVGKFHFKANTGYKVEKVFLNGVQIHDYDGESEFDYDRFGVVDMDNNISVTFATTSAASNDSLITLAVGDHGKATLSVPETLDVTNTRQIYLNTNTVTFTVMPESSDYVVDSVKYQVGTGALQDVNKSGSNYTVNKTDGEATTVYVTFRYNGASAGETPTVFVRSYVEEGKGTIDHTGILIYNKFATPTFTMTADTGFQATSVRQSDGVVIPDTLEGTVQANTTDNKSTFTYTPDALENNVTIGAIFKETAYVVTGFVDFDQAKNLSKKDSLESGGGTVTFVRVDDEGKVVDGEEPIVVETTTTRKDATFTAEVPEGKWNVTVSKKGYVDYTLKSVPVNAGGDTIIGAREGKDPKHIVPLIGNTTGNGRLVSLTDAGNIMSAMRQNVSQAIFSIGDVDDDGVVAGDSDLQYIMYNYGKRIVKKNYSDWIAEAE